MILQGCKMRFSPRSHSLSWRSTALENIRIHEWRDWYHLMFKTHGVSNWINNLSKKKRVTVSVALSSPNLGTNIHKFSSKHWQKTCNKQQSNLAEIGVDPFPAQLPIPKEGHLPGMPRSKSSQKVATKSRGFGSITSMFLGDVGEVQTFYFQEFAAWIGRTSYHTSPQTRNIFFKRPTGFIWLGFVRISSPCWVFAWRFGWSLTMKITRKRSCFLVIYVAEQSDDWNIPTLPNPRSAFSCTQMFHSPQWHESWRYHLGMM